MHRDRLLITGLLGVVIASLAAAACESKKTAAESVAVSTLPVSPTPAKAPLPSPEPIAAAPAASAAAPAASAASAAPAAPAAPAASAASAAPGASAASADYSAEGIDALPENCIDPNVVLMAVPKNHYESDTFDWRHVRQVALANPGFHVLHELGNTKGEGHIAFTENEHKPTKGVALVLHCSTPKTCLRFAAAYRTVVPSAKLTPICGANANIGSRINSGRSVLPSSGDLQEVLPEKADVQSQCLRLAACKAARDFRLESDEAQDCMKKPSKFKVNCSLKKTCQQVLTCSGG